MAPGPCPATHMPSVPGCYVWIALPATRSGPLFEQMPSPDSFRTCKTRTNDRLRGRSALAATAITGVKDHEILTIGGQET